MFGAQANTVPDGNGVGATAGPHSAVPAQVFVQNPFQQTPPVQSAAAAQQAPNPRFSPAPIDGHATPGGRVASTAASTGASSAPSLLAGPAELPPPPHPDPTAPRTAIPKMKERMGRIGVA